MVHLETMRSQHNFYMEHRKEILTSGHRYAVIDGNQVHYFDSEKSLYRKHPYFKPSAEAVYGTLPLCIDIDAKTNHPRHLKRVLAKKIEKFEDDLIKVLEKGDELAAEEARLSRISARSIGECDLTSDLPTGRLE